MSNSTGISNLPGYLRVEVGRGGAAAVMDSYREAALVCMEHSLKRALVVAIEGDPEAHEAVRSVIRTLALDRPPGLRMALVAACPGTEQLFESTAELGRQLGLDVGYFSSETDAVSWLLG